MPSEANLFRADPPATWPSGIETDPDREELHFRRIDMRGFRRRDGLFEIEGRLTDRKPFDFSAVTGNRIVPAGDSIHDMGVRLVIDEHLVIHDVQTFTLAAPYAPCPEGGRALQSLKGLRMASGWSREVRSRLDGARSCTHLREILIPLATTAIQALSVTRVGRPEPVDADGKPLKIDSCYAYAAEREVVLHRWPEFHRSAPSKA